MLLLSISADVQSGYDVITFKGRIRRLSDAKQLAECLNDQKLTKAAESTKAMLKLRAQAAELEKQLEPYGGALPTEDQPSSALEAAVETALALRTTGGDSSATDYGAGAGDSSSTSALIAMIAGGALMAGIKDGNNTVGCTPATSSTEPAPVGGTTGEDLTPGSSTATNTTTVTADTTAVAAAERARKRESNTDTDSDTINATSDNDASKRIKLAGTTRSSSSSSSSSGGGGGTAEDLAAEGLLLESKLAQQRSHIQVLVAQLRECGEAPCDIAITLSKSTGLDLTAP